MSQKPYPGFKRSQIYWHIFERVLHLNYVCLDSDVGLLWQLKINANQQQTVFTKYRIGHCAYTYFHKRQHI